MEYDGLLSCQGLRAESLQQPLRWICYEADKQGHCRYCTLLYSEGHVGWFFVTTEVIDLRSFSEGSRSSGRCDSAPSLPLPTKETKRFKVDQRIYTYIVVLSLEQDGRLWDYLAEPLSCPTLIVVAIIGHKGFVSSPFARVLEHVPRKIKWDVRPKRRALPELIVSLARQDCLFAMLFGARYS